jgi:hypothetical protein
VRIGADYQFGRIVVGGEYLYFGSGGDLTLASVGPPTVDVAAAFRRIWCAPG